MVGGLPGSARSVRWTCSLNCTQSEHVVRDCRDGAGQLDGDDDRSDFKGQKRSNEPHQYSTDPDAKLYRKGKTGSELRDIVLSNAAYNLVRMRSLGQIRPQLR